MAFKRLVTDLETQYHRLLNVFANNQVWQECKQEWWRFYQGIFSIKDGLANFEMNNISLLHLHLQHGNLLDVKTRLWLLKLCQTKQIQTDVYYALLSLGANNNNAAPILNSYNGAFKEVIGATVDAALSFLQQEPLVQNIPEILLRILLQKKIISPISIKTNKYEELIPYLPDQPVNILHLNVNDQYWGQYFAQFNYMYYLEGVNRFAINDNNYSAIHNMKPYDYLAQIESAFNLIIMEDEVNYYIEPLEILSVVSEKLSPGGCLVLMHYAGNDFAWQRGLHKHPTNKIISILTSLSLEVMYQNIEDEIQYILCYKK